MPAEHREPATREPGVTPQQVPRWEHFAHQADIGVRGIGRSAEEAFEQAGMALTAVVVTPELIQSTRSATIECEASDLDVLFVDWLNAIVFEMATSRTLFSVFHVRIERAASRQPLWANASIQHGTSLR